MRFFGQSELSSSTQSSCTKWYGSLPLAKITTPIGGQVAGSSVTSIHSLILLPHFCSLLGLKNICLPMVVKCTGIMIVRSEGHLYIIRDTPYATPCGAFCPFVYEFLAFIIMAWRICADEKYATPPDRMCS